ncbi:recombinase, partial [Salmonella enterica]|nr:recombinase [Salmonella enterica subsp. enterica serovar Mbandaka]
GRSGAMKRAAVQWGIGRYLYNLEEGFAQTSLDKKQGWHRAKLKDGTGFYWLPPSLPNWAMPASGNQPSPENTNQKSPSVDCEQILKDFSDYASKETDKKKLIERYQHDWQLLAGNEEAQDKCVQVMNIRINELKQVA